MTFKTAFNIARANSEDFRAHIQRTDEAIAECKDCGCYIFAIDGECFAFGFDGVDLHKVKHTAKRSEYLIRMGLCDVIRG